MPSITAITRCSSRTFDPFDPVAEATFPSNLIESIYPSFHHPPILLFYSFIYTIGADSGLILSTRQTGAGMNECEVYRSRSRHVHPTAACVSVRYYRLVHHSGRTSHSCNMAGRGVRGFVIQLHKRPCLASSSATGGRP
jgi:hypothetical protein